MLCNYSNYFVIIFIVLSKLTITVTVYYRHEQVLEQGVKRTNAMFGGLKIAGDVSNIVFIHGTNDPWHAAGVTKTTNPQSPVIIVQGEILNYYF